MLDSRKLTFDGNTDLVGDFDRYMTVFPVDGVILLAHHDVLHTRLWGSHEVAAKPDGRISTVAQFAHHLVPRVEDVPYSHRVEIIGIIPRQPLFFDSFGGVDRLKTGCRERAGRQG